MNYKKSSSHNGNLKDDESHAHSPTKSTVNNNDNLSIAKEFNLANIKS